MTAWARPCGAGPWSSRCCRPGPGLCCCRVVVGAGGGPAFLAATCAGVGFAVSGVGTGLAQLRGLGPAGEAFLFSTPMSGAV